MASLLTRTVPSSVCSALKLAGSSRCSPSVAMVYGQLRAALVPPSRCGHHLQGPRISRERCYPTRHSCAGENCMRDEDFVRMLAFEQPNFLDETSARQTADAQNRIYDRLLGIIGDIKFNQGSVARSDAELLRPSIATILTRVKVARMPGGSGWTVLSGLPVIPEPQFNAWRELFRSLPFDTAIRARQFSAFMLGGILIEGLRRSALNREDIARVEPDVLPGMHWYSETHYWCRLLDETEDGVLARLASLKAETEASAKAIEVERDQFRTSVAESNAGLHLASTRAEELKAAVDEIDLRLKVMEQAASTRLADLEVAIREELKLNTMAKLWRDRAQQAQIAFWFTVGLLVLMSGGASVFLFSYGEEVLAFVAPFNLRTILLNATAAGAISQQLGRIVLVTVPIIIFFWLMKITVRMMIRSLLLMDDARQRQTIMDSYFLLTKEGERDERALPMMLWALFRQVPGHGPDGIEPPDFTEALNAGLKVGVLPRSSG